ncbi:hypothetical protein [Macrococcus bovicus]|uniref:hypothetical protein n=1 Tax=Macrococcus bovicus TaxID=69968 RepID=UPI0025A583B5|nr:hypothetical protein [Macrococcus bovicus]WJP97308.1 hypothetical protein QSV55_08465 [Macrococcus bovicus]
MEVTDSQASILELTATKYMSEKVKWVDALFDFAFSIINAIKDLKTFDSYYLESKDNRHQLVKISKKLEVEKFDVTNEVNQSPNGKKFIFKDKEFRVFKVIR